MSYLAQYQPSYSCGCNSVTLAVQTSTSAVSERLSILKIAGKNVLKTVKVLLGWNSDYWDAIGTGSYFDSCVSFIVRSPCRRNVCWGNGTVGVHMVSF